VVLLIGVVIGVVVGVRKKESPGPPEPTLAPTTLLEKSYRAQFVAEVGVQVNVPGSAHDRAAEWIISEDPRALPPEAPNLIQRYHLALLYYLTTQNNKTRWNSCNPPMSNETEFCTFQEVQWDNSYEDIPNQTRWMAGVHECEWIGISCDPTLNVIELDFGKWSSVVRSMLLLHVLDANEIEYAPFDSWAKNYRSTPHRIGQDSLSGGYYFPL
jgi:hypothetical protein